MKYICLIIVTSIATSFSAQNLFVNGGLEDEQALLTKMPQSGEFVNGWLTSTKQSATYFYDNHIPVIVPIKGKGMVGLNVYKSSQRANVNYKNAEYIQGIFREPLKAGKEYFFSFDLALHHTSKWAVKSLGCLFLETDKSILKSNDLSMMEPDIRLNNGEIVQNMTWRKFSIRYRAVGGERSMVFGSFGPVEASNVENMGLEHQDGMHNSAYYYLDNFKITEEFQEEGCFFSTVATNYLPRKLTLVLDVSGSMRKAKLLHEIKKGIGSSISDFGPADQINIVAFSSGARTLYSGSKFELTPDSLSKILVNPRMSGSTNVHSGLKRGLDLAVDKLGWQSNKLILLSDGEFTVGPNIKKLLAEKHEVELLYVDLGNKKNNRALLAEIGINYLSTHLSTLSRDLSKVTKKHLFANTCNDEYQGRIEPIQHLFILDVSSSMLGNEGEIAKSFYHLLANVRHGENVTISTANNAGSKKIYPSSGIAKFRSISEAMGRLELAHGDNMEQGIRDGINYSLNAIRANQKQHIIFITDCDPRKLILKEQSASFDRNQYIANHMTKHDADLSFIYINEATDKIELLYYKGVAQGLSKYDNIRKFPYKLESTENLYTHKFQDYYRRYKQKGSRKFSLKRYRKRYRLYK